MSGDDPRELRTLDTSKARKEVVLTTRATGPTPDAKGGGAGRRETVLGAGVTFTSVLSVATGLVVGWLAAAAVLVVGLVATVVLTARAVSAPPAVDGGGSRVQKLQARLDQADLPAAAHQELHAAMGALAAARDRETEAEQAIERTLATLDGAVLQRHLAAAQAGGDAEEIALRQQALTAFEGLVGRRDELRRGAARAEAALDALEVTLAGATTPQGPDTGAVEADSRRLLGQVDALRRATQELEALDEGADRPPRSPERA